MQTPLSIYHILSSQPNTTLEKAAYVTSSNVGNIDSTENFLSSLSIVDKIDTLSTMSGAEIVKFAANTGIHLGLKIIAAILIYIIGGWLIKKIVKIIKKIFEKRKTEPSLATFLSSFISIALTILLIIITINTLGIDTTSLVALIGGAGLAIGMAMSGTLQNIAGGVMILLFKPFKVGDYIQAQGYDGYVRAIEISATHLTTFNNEKIILPNGLLFNGIIKNSTQTGKLRLEWNIDISYGDDFDIAKETILEILNEEPNIIKEGSPAPTVVLTNLGESAVTLSAKAWCKYEDFWDTKFKINEKIYKVLPTKGIHFPFPQIDVHLKN